MNEEVTPTNREVRADARDVRADARDVRADTKDTGLQDREVRAEVREDVVSEREVTVTEGISTLGKNLTTLKWLVVVLIIISVGSLLRSFVIQDAADKATDAGVDAKNAASSLQVVTVEARDASLDTLHELEAILANLEASDASQPDLQNQAIIDALLAVARIEGFLCGGTCPSP